MKNPNQVCNSTKIEDKCNSFVVFFLYDDEKQSVHVTEVGEPNFLTIAQHINRGGSVFIAPRKKPKQKTVHTRNLEDTKMTINTSRI